jgi:Secretion system C-terminal sorting domain
MMKKSLGILITAAICLPGATACAQQIVRASGNVQIVTTAGTKTVIDGGGITFLGTSKWTATADSIYLYKNTATAIEGWLDSTAAGAMDPTSTGNVFFRGTNRQSFYGNTRFYDMTLRNPAGDTLLSSCEVRNILRLDTGRIFTERGYGNDSLLVSNTAIGAITSTSNFTRSWVDGRLSRRGNVVGSGTVNPAVAYLFPVGQSDSLYAPVKLSKVNTATATWTAEYNYAQPFDRYNIFFPPIDHISEVEYWEITSDNQASTDDDAQITLSWRGRSYVSATAGIRDSLLVAQYINRPPFTWDAPGGWVTGRTSGADSLSGTVTSNATTSQYSYDERRFTLGTYSRWNALPAKLLYFTAIADGNRVRLNWEAANEFETIRYEIEKSITGANFAFMASTLSRQMAQSAYLNYDNNPVTGWNYYRLKVIDRSGSFFYSPIRAVKFDKGMEEVRLFPVPAHTVLNIQLPTSYVNQTTLQVIAVDGKYIGSIRPTTNMVVLNVQPLASGTYFIVINKNDGTKETHRFIKQ